MKVIVILIILLLIGSIALSSAIDINYCQELNQSNTIYNLTQSFNTTINCFNVTANNVTLEMNNFEVNGSGYDGFFVNGYNYTELRNGKLNGFRRAINFTYSNFNSIYNISINGNGVASAQRCISLFSSNYNSVVNLDCSYFNSIGMALEDSSNNYIAYVNLTNTSSGLLFFQNSTGNTFKNLVSLNQDNRDLATARNTTRNIFIDSYTPNYGFLDIQSVGTTTFAKTGLVSVKFLTMFTHSTTGTNLSNDIFMANNFISINSSKSGLNKSANITFYNISNTFVTPKIFRDNVVCLDCYNFTALNASTVVFNVSSWSNNYSIGEGYTQPTPPSGGGLVNNLNITTTNSTVQGISNPVVTSKNSDTSLAIFVVSVLSIIFLIWVKR